MSKVSEILAAEGDAAEHASIPDGVRGERRNLARSVMFSLRLNPEELDALEHIADERGIPTRTLARGFIIQAMRAHDSVESRVARLEKAVFRDSA